MDDLVDVSISGPDGEWLAQFARRLVDDRLVACGNIYPAVRSIYRWEGAVEDDAEAVVVLHTRRSLVDEVIGRTRDEHPNDVAQVLAVPVVAADPDYRRWVLESTREPAPTAD